MALSQISVRIDEELKQRTDETMKLLGTNPTQAITLLYQYIAENGKLPFTV
ncbi:type II toxin-antitoxin system RelB/DinJ family antitoxin, partial [Salmonella enterica]|nr:type II toxin-antitoxin system RelB/DinJ family antitoxin [Salmonella enterica]